MNKVPEQCWGLACSLRDVFENLGAANEILYEARGARVRRGSAMVQGKHIERRFTTRGNGWGVAIRCPSHELRN